MADISIQYVAGIRQYLRINHTRFDAEITDLIGAARADLLLGGISEKKGKRRKRRSYKAGYRRLRQSGVWTR